MSGNELKRKKRKTQTKEITTATSRRNVCKRDKKGREKNHRIHTHTHTQTRWQRHVSDPFQHTLTSSIRGLVGETGL